MKSNRAESYEPYQGFTEKYQLPFVWGALHVSQAAHDDYGLVPLTTPGLARLETEAIGDNYLSEHMRTDIWLLGPDEAQIPVAPFPVPIFSFQTQAGIEQVNVKAVFNQTDEEMTDLIENGTIHLAQLGIESEEELSREQKLQQAHFLISHSLKDGIVGQIAHTANDALIDHNHRLMLRNVRDSFLLAGGTVAGLSAIQIASQGDIDRLTEVSSGVMIAAAGGIVYRSLSRYVGMQRQIRAGAMQTAALYAQVVSDDIHRTFCTDHFDYETGLLLDDNGSPDE